jgi:LysM repeat protein
MTARMRTTTLAAAMATLALLGAAAPASSQAACLGHTEVRDGDTLVAIAARCGVTVPALLAANPGISDDLDLRIGRSIAVPDPRARQPTPQQACGAFYTIRDGDTLAEIALKCGVTVPMLVAANPPLPHPLWENEGGVVRIPNVTRAAVQDPLTWVTEAPLPEPAPEAEPEELVRVEGVLERGQRCLMIRADDGRALALAGAPTRNFAPGDRVVIMGAPAPADRCDHTPTLDLRIIHRPAP